MKKNTILLGVGAGTALAAFLLYRAQTGAAARKAEAALQGYQPVEPTLTDHLAAGSQLAAGASLYSPSRRFRFVMQTDGNLVLYDQSNGKALWASATVGKGQYAVLQTDGNLVVYAGDGSAPWASATDGKGGTNLVVQDDGNVVLYAADGHAVWATDTVQ